MAAPSQHDFALFGERMARLIEGCAPVFADPDSVLEDTAMEIEITWRDVHKARALVGSDHAP